MAVNPYIEKSILDDKPKEDIGLSYVRHGSISTARDPFGRTYEGVGVVRGVKDKVFNPRPDYSSIKKVKA